MLELTQPVLCTILGGVPNLPNCHFGEGNCIPSRCLYAVSLQGAALQLAFVVLLISVTTNLGYLTFGAQVSLAPHQLQYSWLRRKRVCKDSSGTLRSGRIA